MKRFFISVLRFLLLCAILSAVSVCGFFSPCGIPGNSRYPELGVRAEKARAFARGIMIHSSRWVDYNRWRRYIPLNGKCCLGCVTVSTRDMAYINRLVGQEQENLLLWSYYNAE